ncbi:MAG: helix-turn-helix transcriptional regulator [Desulfomicrobium sp.]|nr:helix-turn-helix transcriptional regulator [Desulfomicrobium sp.]NLV98131.1 helix-turn-helix transcriptional regulator [Desulfovibrionales bacterium]
MSTHTEIQIIKDRAGNPAFVVLPYVEWIKQSDQYSGMISNEVMGMIIRDEMTPARAWREHLGFTQTEVAQRAGMSQAALSQIESGAHTIRKATREKLARAMGITAVQLE